MQIPQWVARLNRRVTNPVLGTIAPWAPLFGVVKHTGRASGRAYSTPVVLFGSPDGFLVILTYGPDRDWLKNLAAAGGGEVVHRGTTFRIGPPEVLPSASAGLSGLPKAVAGLGGFESVAVLPKR